MRALLDVNVLLALAWSNHVHHDAAHDWFSRESHSGWSTCLLTQSAFLRLSMNPQLVGASIDFSTARQLLSRIVNQPTHKFVAVGPPMTSAVLDELGRFIKGYRQMSDVALLLIARVADLKLVTMDEAIASICPWREQLQMIPVHSI